MDPTNEIDELDRGPRQPRPVYRPVPVDRRPHHGGSILMAAMIGLSQALGMEPEPVEIVQLAERSGDDGFNLDFGGLPPLN